MSSLSPNWITEKHIDFEYKKYVLLAYLQEVSRHFDLQRLYPSLAELVEHYRQSRAIKENKENLFGTFPQKLSGIDPEKFRPVYETIVADDALMAEIESIVDFSLTEFEKHLAIGKKIYDHIEKHIEIAPVGLIPLNPLWGYMFLRANGKRGTEVYEYEVTIIEQSLEKYRGIHTRFVRSYSQSFANTYESIKTDLIRGNRSLPNPAAYAIESEIEIPLEETFLPIAKRLLVRYLSAA